MRAMRKIKLAKTKLILSWLLACCMAAALPAYAAGGLGQFVVPPNVSPQALPLGAPVRAVKLARVVVQLSDGQPWASVRVAYLPDPPLVWRSGKSDLNPGSFSRVLDDEFRTTGFRLESETADLFESGSAADFQIAALIDDMKGRFCFGCGILTKNSASSGAVLMNVEWQVYSVLERRVVARIRTMGGFETSESQAGNELRISMEAFRQNARQLLASPEFRALVTEAPAAVTRAGTLKIATVQPTTARPIPEAIAVAPVIFAGDSMGSAFLISRDGYLVTNQHVVGDVQYVKVRWPDGSEGLGEVIRSNRQRDVALVKTDPQGRRPLALSQVLPMVGDSVFAIGAPLRENLQGTVTKGIVSALRTDKGLRFIQSDVSINHGNSGGPLLNERGAVLGITVSGIQLGEAPAGINFFIPISDALEALSVTPIS